MERKHGSNWIDNAVYNEQLEALKVDIVNCNGDITQNLIDQISQLEEDIAQDLLDNLSNINGDLTGGFSVMEDQLAQIIDLLSNAFTPAEPVYPVPVPYPYKPPIIPPDKPGTFKPKSETITKKTKIYIPPKNPLTVDVDLRVIKFGEGKPVEHLFHKVSSIEFDKLFPMKNVPVDFEIRNKRLMDQVWSYSTTNDNPGYYFLYLSGTNKPYRFGPYKLIDAGKYIQYFPLNGKKCNILNIKK